MNNTKRVINDEGGNCYVFLNSDVIRVGNGITEAIEGERVLHEWIGASRVYYNQLAPDNGIPRSGLLEYYRVDEKLTKLSDKPIFRDVMPVGQVSRPGDKGYYANHPEIGNRASSGIMFNSYTGKPMKTKSGKPRKENPLKNKNKGNRSGRSLGRDGR